MARLVALPAALLCLAWAAPAKTPTSKVTWIQAAPGDFVLSGKWSYQHVLVTGKLADGTVAM